MRWHVECIAHFEGVRYRDYSSWLQAWRHLAPLAPAVTALGNPLLLERMSSALLQVRELFAAGDTNGERVECGSVALYYAFCSS